MSICLCSTKLPILVKICHTVSEILTFKNGLKSVPFPEVTVHDVSIDGIVALAQKLEMWANAQRDGRLNIDGALCSTPQCLADAYY